MASDPSMIVHRQWATRPADERHLSLHDLYQVSKKVKEASKQFKISTKGIEVTPKGNDLALVMTDGRARMEASFNNWSAKQISALSGIPGAMYEQPAPLLAQNFNWGLRSRESEEVQALVTLTPQGYQTRALTGPTYGRIWNADVMAYMIEQFGDGVTGDWRVPGIRGTKLAKVTKDNTTIFGGEQDIFVFLADEEHRVTVKDRRNGQAGTLARGFYWTNSEVGSGKARIGLMLYDFLCANRIIWGLEDWMEIAIRHTAGGPGRWVMEALPKIQEFANAKAAPMEAKIKAAQQHLLGEPDKVIDFLNRRFQKSQTINMMAVHVEEEGRPVATRWDAVTAATAYAKSIPYQNERFQIEKKAGEMLAA